MKRRVLKSFIPFVNLSCTCLLKMGFCSVAFSEGCVNLKTVLVAVVVSKSWSLLTADLVQDSYVERVSFSQL